MRLVLAIWLLCVVLGEAKAVEMDPPPSPVSCWPLNGDADDVSARMSGVAVGGVSFPRAVSVGGVSRQVANLSASGYFSLGRGGRGEEACVGLPETALTVSVWIMARSTLARGGFVGCIQDNGAFERGWVVGTRNGSLSFGLKSAGSGSMTELQDVGGIVLGRWYHVAATYDGAAMRLYVDGVMKAESTEQSGDIQYAHIPEDEFVIGSFRDLDEDHRHDGGINDVALWDVALSAGQVASLYSTPSATTVCEIIACKPSSVACWPLSGDTEDYVRNGTNGAVVGQISLSEGVSGGGLPRQVVDMSSSGYIQLAEGESACSGLPTSALTVSVWVMMRTLLSWGGFVGCIQDNGSFERGWVLGTRGSSNTKLSFALKATRPQTGWTMLRDVDDAVVGRWYHVAATYDGAAMRLYVDGVMKAESTDQSGDIQYAHVPYDEFVIGSFRDLDENHRHNGEIKDVALWDVALSAGQVASLYSTPSATTVCESVVIECGVDPDAFRDLEVRQSQSLPGADNMLNFSFRLHDLMSPLVYGDAIIVSGLGSAILQTPNSTIVRASTASGDTVSLFCGINNETDTGIKEGDFLRLMVCPGMRVAPITIYKVSIECVNPSIPQESPKVEMAAVSAGKQSTWQTIPHPSDTLPDASDGWAYSGLADPLRVMVAGFGVKSIGQSNPFVNTANVLTVTFLTNVDVEAGSIVTIAGLAGAVVSGETLALTGGGGGGGSDGHGLFCHANQNATAAWLPSGGVTLSVCSGKKIEAGTVYSLSFVVTNSPYQQDSPQVSIALGGSLTWHPVAMDKSTQIAMGIEAGSRPMLLTASFKSLQKACIGRSISGPSCESVFDLHDRRLRGAGFIRLTVMVEHTNFETTQEYIESITIGGIPYTGEIVSPSTNNECGTFTTAVDTIPVPDDAVVDGKLRIEVHGSYSLNEYPCHTLTGRASEQYFLGAQVKIDYLPLMDQLMVRQSNPVPLASNEITVVFSIENLAEPVTHPQHVSIYGLDNAILPEGGVALARSNSSRVFCVGPNDSTALWNSTAKRLTLQLCPGQALDPSMTVELKFTIVNSDSAQPSNSVTVNIEGSDVNGDHAAPMPSDTPSEMNARAANPLADGWAYSGLADPLRVMHAGFGVKSIGQSNPFVNTANVLTVTFLTNVDVEAGSIVTIAGLAGAVVSGETLALTGGGGGGGSDGHGLFCHANQNATAAWLPSGGVTLSVCSGKKIEAGTVYSLSFVVTNSPYQQDSPQVSIALGGSLTWHPVAMDKSSHTLLDVESGSDLRLVMPCGPDDDRLRRVFHHRCGDGRVTEIEYVPPVRPGRDTFGELSSFCDDGNNVDSDGCSAECTVESGFVCGGGNFWSEDTCVPDICGDGRRINTTTQRSPHADGRFPRTCEEYKRGYEDQCVTDGEVWLYVNSNPHMPVKIFCKNMQNQATEFITLADTASPGRNKNHATFVSGTDTDPKRAEKVAGFLKIRVDLSTPRIVADPEDTSFVTGDSSFVLRSSNRGWGSAYTQNSETVRQGLGWYSNMNLYGLPLQFGASMFLVEFSYDSHRYFDSETWHLSGHKELQYSYIGRSGSSYFVNTLENLCVGGTFCVSIEYQPGMFQSLELLERSCDDGNTESGDGCSSECTVEDGYLCNGGGLLGPDTCEFACIDELGIPNPEDLGSGPRCIVINPSSAAGLREVASQALTGDVIRLSEGVFTGATWSCGLTVKFSGVTIRGQGQDNTVINCRAAGTETEARFLGVQAPEMRVEGLSVINGMSRRGGGGVLLGNSDEPTTPARVLSLPSHVRLGHEKTNEFLCTVDSEVSVSLTDLGGGVFVPMYEALASFGQNQISGAVLQIKAHHSFVIGLGFPDSDMTIAGAAPANFYEIVMGYDQVDQIGKMVVLVRIPGKTFPESYEMGYYIDQMPFRTGANDFQAFWVSWHAGYLAMGMGDNFGKGTMFMYAFSGLNNLTDIRVANAHNLNYPASVRLVSLLTRHCEQCPAGCSTPDIQSSTNLSSASTNSSEPVSMTFGLWIYLGKLGGEVSSVEEKAAQNGLVIFKLGNEDRENEKNESPWCKIFWMDIVQLTLQDMRLEYKVDDASTMTVTEMPMGEWTQMFLVHTLNVGTGVSTVKLFFNGEEVALESAHTVPFPRDVHRKDLRFGTYNHDCFTVWKSVMDGSIRDFHVWRREISVKEMQDLRLFSMIPVHNNADVQLRSIRVPLKDGNIRYELHPSFDATLDSSVLLSIQSSSSAKSLDDTSVLEFDGISDFLAVKLMDDKQGRWDIAESVGGQLLLAAWVKTPDPSRRNMTILEFGDAGGGEQQKDTTVHGIRLSFFGETGRMQYRVWKGPEDSMACTCPAPTGDPDVICGLEETQASIATVIESNRSFPVDAWVRVAVVHSIHNATMYWDGMPVASGAVPLPDHWKRRYSFIGKSDWHQRVERDLFQNNGITADEFDPDQDHCRPAELPFAGSLRDVSVYKLDDMDQAAIAVIVHGEQGLRGGASRIQLITRTAWAFAMKDVALVNTTCSECGGGGLLVQRGSIVHLEKCNIKGCQANHGGGISVEGVAGGEVALSIDDTDVIENHAKEGGGIYFQGGKRLQQMYPGNWFFGTKIGLRITRGSILGNSAIDGGGMQIVDLHGESWVLDTPYGDVSSDGMHRLALSHDEQYVYATCGGGHPEIYGECGLRRMTIATGKVEMISAAFGKPGISTAQAARSGGASMSLDGKWFYYVSRCQHGGLDDLTCGGDFTLRRIDVSTLEVQVLTEVGSVGIKAVETHKGKYLVYPDSGVIWRMSLLENGFPKEIWCGSLMTPGFVNGECDGGIALFNQPTSVVVSSFDSTLYVSDVLNHAVRKIDHASRIVSTCVGSGQAGDLDGIGEEVQFSNPNSVALAEDAGFLFVLDMNGIKRVDVLTRKAVTIVRVRADPNLPTNAHVFAPFAIIDGPVGIATTPPWQIGVSVGYTMESLEVTKDGETLYMADYTGTYMRRMRKYGGPVGVDIEGTRIQNNSAGVSGGGISISNCTKSVSLERCTISGNTAAGDLDSSNIDTKGSAIFSGAHTSTRVISGGGGIRLFGSQSLHMRSCFVHGNAAGLGGGVFVQASRKTIIEESDIVNNNAVLGGAASVMSQYTLDKSRHASRGSSPLLLSFSHLLSMEDVHGIIFDDVITTSRDVIDDVVCQCLSFFQVFTLTSISPAVPSFFTCTSTRISDNRAESGGGVAALGSLASMLLSHGTNVTNNVASDCGGGLLVSTPLPVDIGSGGTSLVSNTAFNDGGAVCVRIPIEADGESFLWSVDCGSTLEEYPFLLKVAGGVTLRIEGNKASGGGGAFFAECQFRNDRGITSKLSRLLLSGGDGIEKCASIQGGDVKTCGEIGSAHSEARLALLGNTASFGENVATFAARWVLESGTRQSYAPGESVSVTAHLYDSMNQTLMRSDRLLPYSSGISLCLGPCAQGGEYKTMGLAFSADGKVRTGGSSFVFDVPVTMGSKKVYISFSISGVEGTSFAPIEFPVSVSHILPGRMRTNLLSANNVPLFSTVACNKDEYNIDPNKGFPCQQCPEWAVCNGSALMNPVGSEDARWEADSEGVLRLVSCPVGHRIRNTVAYQASRCEACDDDEWILRGDDSSLTCQPCPDSAVCPGGGPPIFGQTLDASVSLAGVSPAALAPNAEAVDEMAKSMAQSLGLDQALVTVSEICSTDGTSCQKPQNSLASAGRRQASGGSLVRVKIHVPSGSGSSVTVESVQATLKESEAVTSSISSALAAQGIPATVKVEGTSLALDLRTSGWGYEIMSGGNLKLVSCPMGSILVNASTTQQTCFRCDGGTYSIHYEDLCSRTPDSDSVICRPRSCLRCPIGAVCLGGSHFSPQVESTWEPEVINQYVSGASGLVEVQSAAALRLQNCSAGHVLFRTLDPSLDSCIPCPAGYYLLEPTLYNGGRTVTNFTLGDVSSLCNPCPKNSFCPGLDKVVANTGNWRSENKWCPASACRSRQDGVDCSAEKCFPVQDGSYTQPQACHLEGSCALRALVYRCPVGACLEDGVCVGNNTGPMCALCDEGTTKDSSGVCQECTTTAITNSKIILSVLAVFIFLCVWYVFSWRPIFTDVDSRHVQNLWDACVILVGDCGGIFKKKKDKSQRGQKDEARDKGCLAQVFQSLKHVWKTERVSGLLKVQLTFFQILHTIPWTMRVLFPPRVAKAVEYSSISALNIFNFPSLSCVAAGLSYSEKLSITIMAPIAVLVLLASPTFAVAVLGRVRGTSWTSHARFEMALKQLTSASALFLYVIYPFESLSILQSLRCDGDFDRLRIDYSVPCNDPAVTVWATVGVILYVIGIPVFLSFLLWAYGVPGLARDKISRAELSALIALYKRAVPDQTTFKDFDQNGTFEGHKKSKSSEESPTTSVENFNQHGTFEKWSARSKFQASDLSESQLRRLCEFDFEKKLTPRGPDASKNAKKSSSSAKSTSEGKSGDVTGLSHAEKVSHVMYTAHSYVWKKKLVFDSDISPVWNYDDLGERHAIDGLGMVFKHYKVEKYWFEIIDMLSKLFLTGIIAYIEYDSADQLLFFILTTAAMHVYLSKAPAYENTAVAGLHEYIFAVLSILLLFGLTAVIPDSYKNSLSYDTTDIFLVFLVVSVFLLPIVRFLYKWLHERMNSTSTSKSPGEHSEAPTQASHFVSPEPMVGTGAQRDAQELDVSSVAVAVDMRELSSPRALQDPPPPGMVEATPTGDVEVGTAPRPVFIDVGIM